VPVFSNLKHSPEQWQRRFCSTRKTNCARVGRRQREDPSVPELGSAFKRAETISCISRLIRGDCWVSVLRTVVYWLEQLAARTITSMTSVVPGGRGGGITIFLLRIITSIGHIRFSSSSHRDQPANFQYGRSSQLRSQCKVRLPVESTSSLAPLSKQSQNPFLSYKSLGCRLVLK
jgi:hypothetical protein